MNVPWWSKLISGFIGIFITVAGALVTVILWNDHRMDEKDAKVREEVRKELVVEMNSRTAIRNIQMKSSEDRLITKIEVVSDKVDELSDDVKALYQIGKRIDRKVTLQNGDELPYTITHKVVEDGNKGKEL